VGDNAKALDAIKNNKEPEARDTFYEVNTLFKRIAQHHGYFGMDEGTLWKKIEANHKAVRGIPESVSAMGSFQLPSACLSCCSLGSRRSA